MNVLDLHTLSGETVTEVISVTDHIVIRCGDGICVIKGQIASVETLPVATQLSLGWVSETEAANKAASDARIKEAAMADARRAAYEQLKSEFEGK